MLSGRKFLYPDALHGLPGSCRLACLDQERAGLRPLGMMALTQGAYRPPLYNEMR